VQCLGSEVEAQSSHLVRSFKCRRWETVLTEDSRLPQTKEEANLCSKAQLKKVLSCVHILALKSRQVLSQELLCFLCVITLAL
jgi:hypothetical protein